MSKIGNINKDPNKYFEIYREASFSDLDDAVSFLNNMWSSINNSKTSDTETYTSLILWTTDFISMISKSKKIDIGNQIAQVEEVFRRISRNSEALSNQMDVVKNPTGLVDKTVIIDLVADVTFIAGVLTSFLKWNPLGIGLNVISLFFAAGRIQT